MSENDINVKVEEKETSSNSDSTPYQVIIEDARQDLYKSYAKTRKISNIIMIGMVAAICGIMFLIISNEQALKIVGYSLAGALIVGLIVYYVVTHNRFPNKTKAYVALVANAINTRMFSNQNFSEIKADPEEKLQLSDLISDGVYQDASGINSRNVVHGAYRGHHFLYAEAALVRPQSRKQQNPPLFVGRYISMPNQLDIEGRFVFVYKNPKQPLDLPNAVSDLATLEDKDDFAVYGPEGANYHDLINNAILSQLKKLNVTEHLLNVNVAFWKGHTAVYISYDDAIVSVPFEKPFDYQTFEKSFEDLLICFNAISEE